VWHARPVAAGRADESRRFIEAGAQAAERRDGTSRSARLANDAEVTIIEVRLSPSDTQRHDRTQ